MPLASFARYPLLFGPSPIQCLDRLTRHLGGPTIWAKREDCNSGLAFGGNKVRKLEYLLADALAQGCDTLVSIGGVQSNHTRQVAADNTVRVEEVRLQLLPGPRGRSYAKASADVVQCLDGSWRVYVRERLVATRPAPPDPGQLRARRRR